MKLKGILGAVGIAASVVLAPISSNAVTLELDDLSTVGVDATKVGLTTASFLSAVDGMVGGFNVDIASSTITSTSNNHTLNTTSIQTAGLGALRITATETGLTSFNGNAGLWASGTVSDAASSIKVSHFIDIGDGAGFTLIGSLLDLGSSVASLTTSDSRTGIVGTFDLKTVIDIVTVAGDEIANVNATVVAAVPLPAGMLLLLTGLGGIALVGRRRAMAA